jgi:uncharacterized protein (TIGR02145 family)
MFFVSPVNGATSYEWSVPPDASITSGQGNDSIVVAFGVQSGNVSVTPVNSCGNGSSSSFPVAPFQCGEVVTDGRDLQAYPTVTIGTQCWMKRNMNVGTMLGSGYPANQNPQIIEKYCYNAVIDSCSVYGGLYNWNEAMQYSTTEGAQGICPVGWHLPTQGEWCTMLHYLDPALGSCAPYAGWLGTAGGSLKETGTRHWSSPNAGATNASGFTALGAGIYDYSYSGTGYFTEFLTSSLSFDNSLGFELHFMQTGFYINTINNSAAYSVRCLRD